MAPNVVPNRRRRRRRRRLASDGSSFSLALSPPIPLDLCRIAMDESGAPHCARRKLGPGGGADLISALPDDLLLQVVELLGSVGAAACTSILSRRWRGLWIRLPKVTITLHDVPLGSLPAALHRAARPGLCHYYLDISVPWQDVKIFSLSVSELLFAAARLAPVELRLTLPLNLEVTWLAGDLPCFGRTTSMDLRAGNLHLSLTQPGCEGGFPSLERLSLSGCHVDLDVLIPRCPRLRVLRANSNGLVGMDMITIHSASLQELLVESSDRWTTRIDVKAPLLEQLNFSFHARGDLRVSVLAPMVEKVSWRCSYIRAIYRLGFWGLLEVGINTTERPGPTDSGKGACLQLPGIHVLSLHMCAQGPFNYLDAEFAAEIGKHMVTSFSGLELHLRTRGHVFGAFVLHLLGMDRICTALRYLKIVLLRPEAKDACPVNCLCDDTKYWRTETISLADLENMEIEGVCGEDHEFDFLKVIFGCAPMLNRVTVKLSDGVTPSVDWCTKINNIFMAYPFVECNADLGQSCVLTS